VKFKNFVAGTLQA